VDAMSNEVRTYTATAKDVATRYGVSRAHVYNLVEQSDVPHRRIGNAIRFNLGEVDEWMRERGQAVAARSA